MSIIALVKAALIFRKNLVKVFVHLIIHTSFRDLRKRMKNTNWMIVLNIRLVFLLCVVRISAAFNFVLVAALM